MSKALDLSDQEFQQALQTAAHRAIHERNGMIAFDGSAFISVLAEAGYGIIRLPVAPEIESQEREGGENG